MIANLGPVLLLLLLGAGWGLTMPLTKIAFTGGHAPLGILVWQMILGAIILGGVLALRKGLFWPNRAQWRVAFIIVVIGSILPGLASYTATYFLPAGIVSMLCSMVPLFAFPIALGMGLERFSMRRFVGLLLGGCGILFLILPQSSLPDPALAIFIPLAMIAPAFYGYEGNFVAKWGLAGMDPLETLFVASVVGCCLIIPVSITMQNFIMPVSPMDASMLAVLAIGALHSCVYSGYVWLIGKTGSVFAAQVAYGVTFFGIAWSMLILGERYSGMVWVAFCCILLGMFFVRPRRASALAQVQILSKDGRATPHQGA